LSLFVTFEGPEGSGKTTQLHMLASYLRERGEHVLTTREPGGTRIGDRVRAILLDDRHREMLPTTEFLLFSAARAQHVGQVIRPHLEQGGIVLCDRYADSSLAYQGYGYGRDVELLRAITHYATGGLVPHLTLFIDLPVEVGLQRKARGSGDSWNRLEQMGIEYHERVRRGYLAMAAEEPERWVVLDGTHDLRQIQAEIRRLVTERRQILGARGGKEKP
jgi:dTMP kinase